MIADETSGGRALPAPARSSAVAAGPPRCAFVLPGGATRGAAQVGMLLALTEFGITPDFLVGTSVGALNAVCYSADPSLEGLHRLDQLWMNVSRPQIFPLMPRAIAKNLRASHGYLLPNDGLRRWIEAHTPHGRLEDFVIPVHAVATDVDADKAVVVSSGDTVGALLASTAIRGIFPPVDFDGRRLCDGAVTADTPLPQAVALGASTIYVLSTPTPVSTTPAAAWQVLDKLFGQPVTVDQAPECPGVTVHHLPPPQSPTGNPFSFRSSRRLIDEAYLLARSFLADLPSHTTAAAPPGLPSPSSARPSPSARPEQCEPTRS